MSVSSTRTSAVQTESDFLSLESVSAGANVVKNGPQYPNVFADNEKISSLEGEWDSNDLYKFSPSFKVWKIHSTLIPKVALNSYSNYGSNNIHKKITRF